MNSPTRPDELGSNPTDRIRPDGSDPTRRNRPDPTNLNEPTQPNLDRGVGLGLELKRVAPEPSQGGLKPDRGRVYCTPSPTSRRHATETLAELQTPLQLRRGSAVARVSCGKTRRRRRRHYNVLCNDCNGFLRSE